MPHRETEGDLIFDFDYALNKPNTRFESKYLQEKTSMRPVDFLVEEETIFRFIEVKDPDIPNPDNPQKFADEMASGEIIEDLSRKFRDSYFFFSLQNREQKEVEYVVLICWSELDRALLPNLSDRLKRTIPWQNGSYRQTPLTRCVILTKDKWHEEFGNDSVWRASEIEG